MLLKHIVVGLLLNTITLTQAQTAMTPTESDKRDKAWLHYEHFEAKEKMLKMYESFKVGDEEELTKEQ